MLSFQTERVRALFGAERWNVAWRWTFKVTHYTWWSRDSLVSVATKRCVEQSRNCVPICDRRKRFFCSPKGRHRLWGLSSLLDRHFVPGLMRLGLEFDHCHHLGPTLRINETIPLHVHTASEHLLGIFCSALSFTLRLFKQLWIRIEKDHCWNHILNSGVFNWSFICRKFGEMKNRKLILTFSTAKFLLLKRINMATLRKKTARHFPLICCYSRSSEFGNIDLNSYNDYVLLFS